MKSDFVEKLVLVKQEKNPLFPVFGSTCRCRHCAQPVSSCTASASDRADADMLRREVGASTAWPRSFTAPIIPSERRWR